MRYRGVNTASKQKAHTAIESLQASQQETVLGEESAVNKYRFTLKASTLKSHPKETLMLISLHFFGY